MKSVKQTLYFILKRQHSGFILWEIVIGLAVFGIIAGVGMKMWKIVHQGRFVRTCEHIQSVITQLRHYRCIHGALPEEEQLQDTHRLTDASSRIWNTLSKDQWIDGVGVSVLNAPYVYPKNALGGGMGLLKTTLSERSGMWLVIAKETHNGLDSAVFTPKEAEQLSRTWGDGTPSSSEFLAQEGVGIPEGQCVEAGKFSHHTKPSCIVYIFVMD